MKFKKALLLSLAFLPIFNMAALPSSAIVLNADAIPQTSVQIPTDKMSVEYWLRDTVAQEEVMGFFFASTTEAAVAILTSQVSPIPEFLGCNTAEDLENVKGMIRRCLVNDFEVGGRIGIVIRRLPDDEFSVDVIKPAANKPHFLDIIQEN
ncbi:MAG: hypothetical protein LBJ95_04720 [Oscillospiraceae bacterium]|jgi:hypothetical protein|nr:hypothetical protein [Oscillospiraceae bacterium]